VNSFQEIFTYDSNNNWKSNLIQNWYSNSWINSTQELRIYDSNNFFESFSHKSWSFDGSVINNGDSTHLYYHTIETRIPDLIGTSLSVYPNPSNGHFTINSNHTLSNIEIYNLLGERIYKDFKIKLQTSGKIDLSGYAKGIYLIKVYDGTKLTSRKVIIQ